MSRFDKDAVVYDRLNMEESSCESLMGQLRSYVDTHRAAIQDAVVDFKHSDKEYSVVELSDSIVLVLKRSEKNRVCLSIGYPFKLYADTIHTDVLEEKAGVGVDLTIHLRGKPVRDKQREILVATLQKDHETSEYAEIDTEEKFQSIANAAAVEAINKNNSCLYVDPYNFIGDSIVGLYFLDYFVRTYGIKNAKVLSSAHKHTDFFYPSCAKDKTAFERETESTRLVIMPDLIDNHFSSTMQLLRGIKNKKLIVFIISRNLIIEFDNNAIKIYHYNRDDILLRSESVQEYMGNSLAPFAPCSSVTDPAPDQASCHKTSGPVDMLINPFSSEPLKDISPHDAREIIVSCRASLYRTVYVALGTGSKRETEWMQEFRKDQPDTGATVVPLQDKGLAHLAKQITDLRVGIALTVDTAMAHLLTRMNIPNATLYNDGFWDKNSAQSLSAESPLGFCSKKLVQMPVIRPKDAKPDFLRYIANLIENMAAGFTAILESKSLAPDLIEFQSKLSRCLDLMREKKDLSGYDHICQEYYSLKSKYTNSPFRWIFEIYDPVKLLEGIFQPDNTEIIPLVQAAFSISPISKLARLITPAK